LQQQIAGLNEGSLLDGEGIDDAVEWGADTRFAQCVFSGIVGSLRHGSFRFNFCSLRLRIAFLLFLFERSHVGLGALQCVFLLAHLAGRCSAFLLQAPQRFQIALGGIARGKGICEIFVEFDELFLRASGLQRSLVGLCRFYLCLSARGLGANIVVVELQQKLSLTDVVALLHQQAFHRGRDRRVRFEIKILNGFDLAVGGNHAADGTTLDACGAHSKRRRVEIGIKKRECHQSYYDPDPA
jgi:hypothetical protein